MKLAVTALAFDRGNEPLTDCECGLERIHESRTLLRLHAQAVDHEFDVVLVVAPELNLFVQAHDPPIDARTHIARLAPVRELPLVAALATTDHRGEQHECSPRRALGENGIGNLLGRIGLDDLPALRTVRGAEPRHEQAQEIPDLGHRSDRRTRIARDRLLIDGDGRAQALDVVQLGLLDAPHELPGVGRQALEEAPLPLSVDGVVGERTLARARDPREADEAVTRNREIDAFQVVFASTFERELVH